MSMPAWKKLVGVLLIFLVFFAPLSPVEAGTASHATGSVTGFITIPLVAASIFGYNIAGLIMPIVVNPKLNATPHVFPEGTYEQNAVSRVTPLSVQQNTVDWTNKNPVSAKYCVKIVIKPPFMKKIVLYDITDTTTEISLDWLAGKLMGQYGQSLAGAFGLFRVMPDSSGKFNLNPETHVVSDISTEDCGYQDPATQFDQKTLDVNQFASLNEGCSDMNHCSTYQTNYTGPEQFHWVIKMVEGFLQKLWEPVIANFPIQIYVTRKSGDGYVTNLQATNGRANPKNTNGDMSQLAQEQGAWSSSLLPRQYLDQPIDVDAKQNQDVSLTGGGSELGKPVGLDVAFKNTNGASTDVMTSTCFVAPIEGQTVLAAGTQDDNKPVSPYCQPTPTPTPVAGWNCRTGLQEQLSSAVNSAAKQWITGTIYPNCSQNTQNAWDQCHNDVVLQAKAACVDPTFALAIWIHESAASAYKCGEQLNGTTVQDFGINGAGVPSENFTAQLKKFLSLNYSCPQTMNDWVSMFWFGNGCFDSVPDSPVDPVTGLTPKQKIEQYVQEIQDIYSQLGGGTLPNWPKSANCNPGNL